MNGTCVKCGRYVLGKEMLPKLRRGFKEEEWMAAKEHLEGGLLEAESQH